MTIELEPSNVSREGQLGLGAGLTTDLAQFEPEDVLCPGKTATGPEHQKHQTPMQTREGAWESPYEI